MPVIPGEQDQAIKQNLAQQNAEIQQKSNSGEQQTQATVKDHQANLGPVVSQNLGEPASKEELRKRAEELNS